jgi:hypothetical protein
LSIAFSLLLVCVVFVFGSAPHDGSAAQSLVAVLAALAVASVAVAARAADVKFAAQATRSLKYAAAVPAVWIILQLLPVPFGAHSIWAYANNALGRQSWGHISIDLGATLLALVFYLANIALMLVTLFLGRDRRRAELILFVLTAVSAITALLLLAGKWGLIAGVGSDIDEVLGAVAALGALLSLTSIVRAVERCESRGAEAAGPTLILQAVLLANGVGLLICLGGLTAAATLNVGLVAAFAVATFASVQVIRRVGLAGWATGILVATMIVAAGMIVVWRYDSARMLSPFLQFATASPSDAILVAQRLLSDTGWAGTGAGTYAALVPIYQNLGNSITKAPSTAAAFAIELGWPMAVFAIAVVAWLLVILYHGALARGRDSFYPAAAAACTVLILGQAFCDTSLLKSCVAVASDAIIGLGLAQSVSSREIP